MQDPGSKSLEGMHMQCNHPRPEEDRNTLLGRTHRLSFVVNSDSNLHCKELEISMKYRRICNPQDKRVFEC